jgi:rare lipoprotein A
MRWVRLPLVLVIGLMLIYDGYCLGARRVTPRSVIVRSVAPVFVQSGMASWYGREHQGKPTTSGETFNRRSFTAASRHLPFNTVVRVTNEKNGRSINVRINDRGPFTKGRVLDLSEAAADSLDMKHSGTARVKIQVVQPDSAQAAPLP